MFKMQISTDEFVGVQYAQIYPSVIAISRRKLPYALTSILDLFGKLFPIVVLVFVGHDGSLETMQQQKRSFADWDQLVECSSADHPFQNDPPYLWSLQCILPASPIAHNPKNHGEG